MKLFNWLKQEKTPVVPSVSIKKAYVIVYKENSLPTLSDEDIIASLKAKYLTDELVVIVTDNPVEVIFNESNN